ncbi:hypothetical protein K488DRAFT_88008 [Vararia minispora EC-137]|uniref:Uncharacterized protein n=1 Tax=Vararia minispora EC-137 TaxID=1314806 RepID=A0ACB8QEF4_9AGAM|nr:hypothetical protein K488DRAFT_88008 [Vararia minispora EC-137]
MLASPPDRNNVVALLLEAGFYGVYINSFLRHTHFLSTREPTTLARRRIGLIAIWYLFAVTSFDVVSGVVVFQNQVLGRDLKLWSAPAWLEMTLKTGTALSPLLTLVLLHIVYKEASVYTKFRISVMEMSTVALGYLLYGVIDGNDHSTLQNALCIFILCMMLVCEILFLSSIYTWLTKTLRAHPHPIYQLFVFISESGVACSIVLIVCMISILSSNPSIMSVLLGPMLQAACMAISALAVRLSVKISPKAAQDDEHIIAIKPGSKAEAVLLVLRVIRDKPKAESEEAQPEEV